MNGPNDETPNGDADNIRDDIIDAWDTNRESERDAETLDDIRENIEKGDDDD